MRSGRGQKTGRCALVASLLGLAWSTSACGLVLRIDDVPPIPGHDAGREAAPEAGSRDVRGADTTKPHDAARPEATIDAQTFEPPDVGQLPAKSGLPTTSDASINFAARYLWLGETDKTAAFTSDPSAWITFGYNIDGKVTTSTSTDVCTLDPNALPTAQVDGNEGADDSFGENLVGDISIAFGGGISADLSKKIGLGFFTFQFDTTGLSTSTTQTNTGLSAEVFGGSRFAGMPTFTLADSWPVDPATLADGVSLVHGAKISFSDAYVVNGVWVSGDPTDIIFTIAVSQESLVLVFHQAVATFQHTLDDAGAHHARSGMIAGILKASELITSIKGVIGGISGGQYCGLVPTFAAKIEAAQDIMENGTNVEGSPCNGISVAIAFTADQIQLPTTVGPIKTSDASVPSCPSDAGPDGSP